MNNQLLIDPKDKSAFSHIENNQLFFESGNSYALVGTAPVLIDESASIFKVADIASLKPTTQDKEYRKQTSYKNYIRQRLLPTLSNDTTGSERYARIAKAAEGGKVLIIGTGAKKDKYTERFPKSEVVTSDVHLQFGADYAIDAHQIPFKGGAFSAVVAAQVLEHTAKPWIVAEEIQRVTKVGGQILIEVPFTFPYHSPPYDFYRFTPTALRFLFAESKIISFEAPEGQWSGAAVALAQAFIDSFKNNRLRQAALLVSRITLGWMKYLDRGNNFNAPKGFSVVFEKTRERKTESELLAEVEKLIA